MFLQREGMRGAKRVTLGRGSQNREDTQILQRDGWTVEPKAENLAA
jgi:hypothetical protein